MNQNVRLAQRTDLHIARKLWHVGVGSIVLFAYFHIKLPIYTWASIVLLIGFIGISLDLFRLRVPEFNRVFISTVGVFMRNSEREKLSGLPFYAFGAGTALLIFPEKIAILAIMFLVFADPICSFFGILYGTEKIFGNKSLEGALAGFVTCYLITLAYGFSVSGFSFNLLAFALIAGLIGTISELSSVYVDDNLAIPLVSGIGLIILNGLIPIF
jgi:diacylglycerol kinase (CTP)